jgi:hypothetical protein
MLDQLHSFSLGSHASESDEVRARKTNFFGVEDHDSAERN